MAITTVDGLVAGLTNQYRQSLLISKASIATQGTGGFTSLWRATGIPGQGAIPGAAAVCDNTLLGCMPFTNPVGGRSSYLARAFLVSGNSATDVQIHDRLAHMGGLSGVTTGAQAVNVDVTGAGSNLPARVGATDYSDVMWWAEIYTDIGTTAQTCTVTYTRYPGGVGNTGRTTTFSLGGASPLNQDSRVFQIFPVAGEYIQSIESVSIPVSTGTAGSWGITATKVRCTMSLGLANAGSVYDWASLALPPIADSACLFPIVICGTTSSGTLYGNVVMIQG